MCTLVKEKNKFKIRYYRSIEDFLPYFCKDTLKDNELFNSFNKEELLEAYYMDPDFKEWIDKEFIIANEQLSAKQRNNAITLWTDPKLEDSRIKVLEALLRGCVLGGKTSGAKNVESGHIKALGEKWGGISWSNMAKEIFTCSVCGYTGLGRSNHKRWHGENCKLPLMEKVFALLPNHFTRSSAKEILKKNNIEKGLTDKLIFKDPTYSSWTIRSYDGIKDHSYDVPVYSKTFDISKSSSEMNLEEFIEHIKEVGFNKIQKKLTNNNKTCSFCNTKQSPGNYVKNGHNTGRCMIPKVKKKTEHQLKKERDLDKVVNFFKDYGWFNVLDCRDFIKKLELINTPRALMNLLLRTSEFKMEISIQPSPAGPRKTKMWIYKK